MGSNVHGAEGRTELSEKSFRVSATDFKSRIENALRPRLAPNTTLEPKMLADELGVTDRVIRNWMAGDNGITGATLASLLAYYFDKGDLAFIGTVIGRDVAGEISRRAKARANAIFELAQETNEAAT